jgi:hypothetical protein
MDKRVSSRLLLPGKKTKKRNNNLTNQSVTLPALKPYVPKSPKSIARDLSKRILDKYSPVLERKREKSRYRKKSPKLKPQPVRNQLDKYHRSSQLYLEPTSRNSKMTNHSSQGKMILKTEDEDIIVYDTSKHETTPAALAPKISLRKSKYSQMSARDINIANSLREQ